MAALAEKLLDHGIRLRSYGEGSQKITCPRCSHTRRKKTDRCLSVTITGERAVWKCHHCDDSGAVGPREREVGSYRRPRGQAHAKPTRRPDPVSPAILAWFEARGISEATVQRNRIGATQVRMPGIGAETDCIAFPYYRDGELVNIKFRALASKHFSQIKGAEKILYGLDDLARQRDCDHRRRGMRQASFQ
jgi:twinkle protein